MGAMHSLVWLACAACGFTGTSSSVTGDAAPLHDATVAIDAAPAVLCGNGIIDPPEMCDDHNTTPGDGCSATCQIEPASECPTPGQPCKHVSGLSFMPALALASGGTSGGGNMFTHACASGTALVGFGGTINDNDTTFGELFGICAAITFSGSGTATQANPTNTATQGTEADQSLGTTTCAADSVVVGYTTKSNNEVSSLALICMPLSFVHGALAFGAATTLTAFGPATGNEDANMPTQCPAGQATTVYEGHSGSTIDHLDLKCASITVVTD
jgi:cysteine-rich repeat protein